MLLGSYALPIERTQTRWGVGPGGGAVKIFTFLGNACCKCIKAHKFDSFAVILLASVTSEDPMDTSSTGARKWEQRQLLP